MPKSVVVHYEQVSKPARAWKMAVFVLIVLAIAAVLIQVLAVTVVGDTPNSTEAERLLAISNARGSLIQFLAGVGLLVGGYFTARTYLLNRHANRTDRFADAVKNMGNTESATVRIGGLHSLRLLCVEEPAFWPIAEQTLAQYLRESAEETLRASEVRAVLAVFRERPSMIVEGNPKIDLSGINLAGFSLAGLNLERARLDDANLTGCDLTDATLTRASLIRTKLNNAKLLGTDLTDSELTGAELRGADLFRATVNSAQLANSDLTGIVHYNP